ncbi:hypothetical protein F2Q70_00021449 [Brassica cretica]|uniref:Uncharacterized protein n=2 Tax=Brassica cretica TaxID=69181 RepID=A0A8S9HBH2_BRACR|nr:hypothetical protein F2Q70_00021449 [Brassica cretica]KAF2555383.1 hypothetical protein F2Q68_00015001 [Brassica cretica]KAF3606604.1 hypothetical protein DY000_02047744 [Brassica cretica]
MSGETLGSGEAGGLRGETTTSLEKQKIAVLDLDEEMTRLEPNLEQTSPE